MKIEATGKSVEIAIQNGLLETGMKREDVEVKVVEEGGLFKKARVIISWDETPTTEEQPKSTILSNNDIVEDNSFKSEKMINKEAKENKESKWTERPKRIIDTKRLQAKGIEFLTGLVKKIDTKATVECEAMDNELTFKIQGDNLGKLIGHKGDTIQSLQVIMSGLKNKSENGIKVYLDINNYKLSKNQNIIDLANKTADQAVKIERNIHLDPMNAYDRRIVHTTLQNREDVTTESTGEGEKRHVVIKPTYK